MATRIKNLAKGPLVLNSGFKSHVRLQVGQEIRVEEETLSDPEIQRLIDAGVLGLVKEGKVVKEPAKVEEPVELPKEELTPQNTGEAVITANINGEPEQLLTEKNNTQVIHVDNKKELAAMTKEQEGKEPENEVKVLPMQSLEAKMPENVPPVKVEEPKTEAPKEESKAETKKAEVPKEQPKTKASETNKTTKKD